MSLVAECPECGDRKLVDEDVALYAPTIWCSHYNTPDEERTSMDAFVPMEYCEMEPATSGGDEDG